MNDKPSPEEVAVMVRARQLLKKYGMAPEADIKTICENAGTSRKTGYEWAKKFLDKPDGEETRSEFESLRKEHEALEKAFDDLRFENEGRKIAWKIHGGDLIAGKKKLSRNLKKRTR
jgi:hypothetical protein